MTPTQAMARRAELQMLSANPGHERSAQDSLLQMAETLSLFFVKKSMVDQLGVTTIFSSFFLA